MSRRLRADADPGETLAGSQAGTPSPRLPDPTLLSLGGMGELRRVFDPGLERVIVQKTVRADRAGPEAEARLIREARLMARLEHPGVLPVHGLGALPDGRPCFTMREVKGETFEERVARHWARGGETAGRLPLALLDEVARVAETVAHAHAQGFVHRDVKPQNIMVGAYGEVLVLDWGLARVEPVEPGEGEGEGENENPGLTRFGRALGTPAWAAPEQLAGRGAEAGPEADVYALGALLYFVLSGRAPFVGSTADEILATALAGPPPDLSLQSPLELPEDLLALQRRAMARDPAARFPDGGAFRAALAAWRDGEGRRRLASSEIEAARLGFAEVARAREEAVRLRASAAQALRALSSWAPVADKAPPWADQDQAARLDRDAEQLEADALNRLQAALRHDPSRAEAHALLADHYQRLHRQAEAARDTLASARWEALLRAHDRGRWRAWLGGLGAVDLRVDAPDARIDVLRYEPRQRRHVLQPVAHDLPAPLDGHPLPHGSYALTVRAPGRVPVRLPVVVGRGETWRDVPPGETGPRALALPFDLAETDVYIPAGWFSAGGDSGAINPLPAGLNWVESFILQRYPVTQADWLDWLNDLVTRGDEAEAILHAPRPLGAREAEAGDLFYGRDADGRFVLVPDRDGDLWQPDWPVIFVSWHDAVAYAAWRAERDQLPWRLPTELEREKAARGVDGRLFPWGDHLDPAFCCMERSYPGRPTPHPVSAFPLDESPYGVRGLAGGSRDWTSDRWSSDGRPTNDENRRVCRGGSWIGDSRWCRAASRGWVEPHQRSFDLGVRLARDYRTAKPK